MPGKRATEAERREQILRGAFEVASREGIGSLTIRAVAAEAHVSHALVIFHFQRKERLVHELLDWLIEATSVLHVPEDVARFPSALGRLDALLQQEMARLSRQPRHVRLFFDFWALGARQETIRARMGAELERYRGAFRAIMAELLLADPDGFGGATADGLASIAVSCLHGCAVQAMIDPEHFDADEYLASVRGVVGQPA